jgi:hypothetical protein
MRTRITLITVTNHGDRRLAGIHVSFIAAPSCVRSRMPPPVVGRDSPSRRHSIPQDPGMG